MNISVHVTLRDLRFRFFGGVYPQMELWIICKFRVTMPSVDEDVETGIFIRCWWEWKLGESFWKTMTVYPKGKYSKCMYKSII